jgi:cation diffusion facilitator CzcD-associated flavoprotein CzcO
MALIYKTNILIIGAGQAGLSAAYHLQKLGIKPGKGFTLLDASDRPGGAWNDRWDSLTLSNVNGIHDLPGLPMRTTLAHPEAKEVPANASVSHYFEVYEETMGLSVWRPVHVQVVCKREEKFRVETSQGVLMTHGILNATGTWTKPYIPAYPGADLFKGEQLHTRDYKSASYFKDKRVLIVGAGISAIQLLDEISKVTETYWVSRRPPLYRDVVFDEEAGRAAVAMVEERVRNGLPPQSVVSVTGLPWTPQMRDMEQRGVLINHPIFERISEDGVVFEQGKEEVFDVIVWCTGFRSALDHLAPLLKTPQSDHWKMDGRLATRVAHEPRIHLLGYGPSASTVGANRAGRAAAQEITHLLGLSKAN